MKKSIVFMTLLVGSMTQAGTNICTTNGGQVVIGSDGSRGFTEVCILPESGPGMESIIGLQDLAFGTTEKKPQAVSAYLKAIKDQAPGARSAAETCKNVSAEKVVTLTLRDATSSAEIDFCQFKDGSIIQAFTLGNWVVNKNLNKILKVKVK